MESVISFNQVSKKFKLRNERSRSFQAYLIEMFKSPKKSAETFSVLRNVSFELKRGETLGIIGINGAGKSTLLKLAARIIRPDRGQIITKGRIAGLLELGAGFHPDLSGRENIYLNGAMLGLARHEINQKLDSIVNFSGVREFIDVPIRNYSSGMLVRLGFAVAAHIDADVLLIDEALSVGDAKFQPKSRQRLFEYKEQGGSSILVSHDMRSLKSLCDRILLFHGGQCIGDGEPNKIIDQYLRLVDQELLSELVKPVDNNSRPALEVKITNVQLTGNNNTIKQVFESGEPALLTFNFTVDKPIESPIFQVQILATGPMYPTGGVVVHGTNTARHKLEIGIINGQGCVSIYYPHLNLLEGDYVFRVGIMPNDQVARYYSILQHACSFKIHSNYRLGSGVAVINHEWRVTKEPD
jgi:ABC-type polysaccharide/polyol phosphate transport system ATPase subunit